MPKEIQDTAAGGYAPGRPSAPMPKYDGFHVRQNQFGYNPASLNIPRAQDSGFMGALDRASFRIDRMADRIQAEQDDARVTAAITDLRRHATDLEAGENGWRKLLQANALEPDAEGKGLVERVDTDMRQYGEKIGEGLTGRQRALFNRHAMNVYQSVYGSVSGHVVTQGMEYQKGVYGSAIDYEMEAASSNGYKLEALKDGEARLLENVDKLADLLGIPQDQRENYRRKYTSGLYTNAIEGVMANSTVNPAVAFQARALLNNHAKDMLGSDINRLKKGINAAIDVCQIRGLTDYISSIDKGYSVMVDGQRVKSVMAKAGLDTNTPIPEGEEAATELFVIGVMEGQGKLQTDTSGIMHDGQNYSPKSRYGASDVSLENAYAVDKNVDPKKLLEDKSYNLQVGTRVLNSCLREFAGDEQMALAAYFSSPSEVKAAQKAATEATDGNGSWFDKMPQNVREKVSKSMKAMETYESLGVKDSDGRVIGSFDPRAYKEERIYMTAQQIDAAICAKDPRARMDPRYRERALNSALAEQNRRKEAYQQEQTLRMAQVSELLYKNGGNVSAIPSELWGSLTRKQQLDVVAAGKKIRNGEDTTNPLTAFRYSKDEDLAVVSMDELKSLRSEYSEKDYKALVTRWLRVHAEGREQQEKVQYGQMAAQMGVPNPAFAPKSATVEKALEVVPAAQELKKKDKVAFANMVQNIQTAITFEGQSMGKAITSEFAVQDAVGRMTNHMGGADPGKLTSLFGTKASGLPHDGKTDVASIAKEQARIRYGHEPSDLEILNTARDIYFNRYAVTDMSRVSLDEATAKKARDTFRAYKGRDPVGSELLRAYFAIRFSGDAPDLAEGFSDIRPGNVTITGF